MSRAAAGRQAAEPGGPVTPGKRRGPMMIELPEAIRSGVEAIRADNRSGAVELAMRAAEVLAEAADAEPFHAVVEATCRELLKAQPSMAPMVNLGNAALWYGTSPRALRRVCARFVEELRASGEAIAREAAKLLAGARCVMTYSASRTVLEALAEAWEGSKGGLVLCTESRPMGEGLDLARKLAGAGIRARLGIDAAMLDYVEQADIAVVGADAVTGSGVVNKRGTALLALAARHAGKKLYALAGTQKFVPHAYRLPDEPPKPAAEILPEAPEGVEVDNRYFDTTPLDWVAAVVTEKGAMAPWRVRERISLMDLHPLLQLH